MPEGALAIVLHTHMPYVEGFGTWPFGEELLWEAVATSYVPLLEVLDERVTLSITPVLADQLEADGAMGRCRRFLEEMRPLTHRLDIEHYAGSDPAAVVELERSAAEYAAVAARLAAVESRPGGLLAALGRHVSWTSSATHAILPLLCLDESVELQLASGIASHRRRFGEWGGGFWLPECAYAGWLAGHLADAGVHHSCIELGGVDPLAPLARDEGPLLWPIDRQIIDLVWGEGGYPSAPEYRARRELTPHHHRIWANDGAVYDPARARAVAEQDAERFVSAVCERVAGGGVSVFAIDTELLGHWWYEGPSWLAAVLAEAERVGLAVRQLDELLAEADPVPAPELHHPVSWGEGGDLRTWSSGRAADMAFRLRTAELRAMSGAVGIEAAPGGRRRLSERGMRELLAAQSSDWAFLEYRGWAGDYARGRADGHLRGVADALAGRLSEPTLRGLAPDLQIR